MIPKFYNQQNASDWSYKPDVMGVYEEAMRMKTANSIPNSAVDKKKTHLLIIDAQKDFCFPEGNLFVGGKSGTGAIDDNKRIAEFIYNNVEKITDITVTLDSHIPYQIFFPWFWIDKTSGKAPQPNTIITSDQIKEGRYTPNPAMASWLVNGNYIWLEKQAIYYCEQLEKVGKYQLYLWPPHCLIGSDGHALAGVINEAQLYHSFARVSEAKCEIKGGHPLTENYSVLSPEVVGRHDGKGNMSQKNTDFIKVLLESDAVIISGQASSHCVKSTIEDLLSEIVTTDPELAKKVYIMTDCMSPVVIPNIADFSKEADEAQEKFRQAGMNLVTSTDVNWLDKIIKG
jgi:nicotinamidase-related amidase